MSGMGLGLPSSFTHYGRLVTLMIQMRLLVILIRKTYVIQFLKMP